MINEVKLLLVVNKNPWWQPREGWRENDGDRYDLNMKEQNKIIV